MQFWQMQLYCGKHGRHCFKYCLSLFWDILTALFTKYSLLLVADEGLAAAEQFKSKSKFKVELSLSCEASFSLHTDGFVTFLASEQNDSFFESIDSMVTPQSNAQARLESCASLPNYDAASFTPLPTKELDAQKLGQGSSSICC